MNQMILAPVGHNNPPPYDRTKFDALAGNAHELADAAGQWKEAGKIESREQAQKANDFLAGARGLAQQIEKQRKEAKKPFLDTGREIDEAFGSLREIVEHSADFVKPLVTQFLREQEEITAAKKAEEERKARAAQEAAEKTRRAAETRNDIVGQQEAKNAIKQAARKAGHDLNVKLGSATGGGRTTSLRRRRYAKISNVNQAMLHYRSHPEMAELLIRLANADIRAAKGKAITIPGVEVIEERKL